jgi:acetoacetyl-CoA synthetase
VSATAPEDESGAPPLLWQPTAADREHSRVGDFLRWLDRERDLAFPEYDELWRWSVEDLEAFWDAVWRFFALPSSAPYSSVLRSRTMPGARWFEGARLNYAEAILARAPEDRPALIAVAEEGPAREIWRGELRGQVGALAAALRDFGVGPGDRVAAYLPNIPEAVVGLLATASLGAVWTSCAPDFGLRSVLDRLGQVEPTVLIAVDGYRWGGRQHDRRDVVAQLRAAMPSVRAVIMVQSLYPDAPLAPPRACPTLISSRNRGSRCSSRWTSQLRSGCCSPQGRPACRRASCTATAASSSST